MNNNTQKSLSDKFYKYYAKSELSPYKGLAVMLVHMQDKFLEDIHDDDEQMLYRSQSHVIQELCVENCVPLINVFYRGHGPVAYALREHINVTPIVQPFRKKSVNAFANGSKLNSILEQMEITTLFSMGIYALGCHIQTGIGAKENDLNVITARDVMADPFHMQCKYTPADYDARVKNIYTDKGIIYYDSHVQFLDDLKNPDNPIFQRNL